MVDVLESTAVLEVTVLELIDVFEVIDVFEATGAAGGPGYRNVVTATQAEIIPVSVPMTPITMLIFSVSWFHVLMT